MDLNLLRSPAELGEYVASLTEAERIGLCEALLFAAARIAFADHERSLRVFAKAEVFGAHFLPVSFYSPIPSQADLAGGAFATRFELPGIVLAKNEHADLLRSISMYPSELSDVPDDADGEFHWNNDAFSRGDAVCYYALLRHLKPRLVLEVGGGYSTLLALRALRANGRGSVLCVEPYPLPFLEALANEGALRLLRSKVQSVPIEMFDTIAAGDVLFIDSTHVSKTGSDVNHLLFRVLPRLRAGAWCHLHDIHYPWEYPERWVRDLKLFWNEQYILMAFLAFNAEFEVMLANKFVERELADECGPLFDIAGTRRFGGASFWIRRVTSRRSARE